MDEMELNPLLAPYHLETELESRSISFENQTGEKGQGGKASRKETGIGRKGLPSKVIQPGEMVELADIRGSGTIRHLWMATRPTPGKLRNIILRGYWENQAYPSIECPIGDFGGCAHGRTAVFQSAVLSATTRTGFNLWLPMPFTDAARFTITNEGLNIFLA